jgi:hypothetical protein
MTEPAELFARLTCEIEDMHGMAIEGQSPDQPPEVLAALNRSIRLRLATCDQITASIAARSLG